MKLTHKHVGQLFHVQDSDGSWVYQLVDVWRGWLLFYDFHGTYVKEKIGKHSDWERFVPTKPWPRRWKAWGWQSAKE